MGLVLDLVKVERSSEGLRRRIRDCGEVVFIEETGNRGI